MISKMASGKLNHRPLLVTAGAPKLAYNRGGVQISMCRGRREQQSTLLSMKPERHTSNKHARLQHVLRLSLLAEESIYAQMLTACGRRTLTAEHPCQDEGQEP